MTPKYLVGMKIKISILGVAAACLLIMNGCQKAKVKPTDEKAVEKAKAQAPTDTTITLPVDSIKLSGKSGNQDDVITGYLWSQISGPNEAAIMNESSQTAIFKGFIAGKYLFQFMVIDASGLTAVDTVAVIVKASQIKTLNLSPSNNPNEINLGLLGSQDATNRTSIEEPITAWTINSVPFTGRNLLKFDLSAIPANATILSADLYMYSDTIPKNGDLIHANYGADNSFVVQQVAAPWDPAAVTWFNQPTGLTANQVVIPNTALPFLNADINVKEIVSSMVSGNANYGSSYRSKMRLSIRAEYSAPAIMLTCQDTRDWSLRTV